MLHHDAGQHGDLGVLAALRVAVNALLMLLARCIGGCRRVYHPLPVVVGGFGVVCGFAGLLALGAGTAMGGVVAVGRPCVEVVCLDVETAVVLRALLIVIAGIQIQVRLTGVVMGMSCIRADVVDCLGVGKDSQIDGVVCKQLILGDGNGDGSSGGRRGSTADGDNQFPGIAGLLLNFGGQTCGQVEPTGNIITHCNVLKLLAVQSNGYVGVFDSFTDLAADRCIGNICPILAGIGIGNLIGFPCSAAVFIHDGFRSKCGRSAEGIRKPGFQHRTGFIAA